MNLNCRIYPRDGKSLLNKLDSQKDGVRIDCFHTAFNTFTINRTIAVVERESQW